MSDRQGAAAIALVNGGWIREVGGRVFRARSSSGGPERVVALTGDGPTCTCPAGAGGVMCRHVRAARLLAAQGRESEVVVRLGREQLAAILSFAAEGIERAPADEAAMATAREGIRRMGADLGVGL